MNNAPPTKGGLGEPPAPLIKALRLIVLALVRLLMRYRVVYPQLLELLKSAYVQVAEHEHPLPGKPQTDTRMSLLTGIHRKDIKRLRTQLAAGVEEPLAVNQSVRIVARWISEPHYRLPDGSAAPLPFKATDQPSFESLVEEVCRQDLRPRVVLDEWLRLGIVSEADDGRITLQSEAFVPRQGVEEQAFFLGMNLSDHLNAVAHNIQGGTPPFFERCVYYDELSDEAIAELRALTEEVGMDALKRINARARELKQRDAARGGGTQRINMGIYTWHEHSTRPETPQ
ncbi:MAG: DUF6502 family protein [Pseudomonadota bacterium]